MKASKRCLDLIKEFESFVAEAYLCPANVWTIGYGTTRINGKPVTKGMKCTPEQAEEYLRADVKSFEDSVNEAVKVQLTQNMFDALVSFTYNLGSGSLKKSTLLKKINANQIIQAADEFLKWNKADGKVLKGLTRRRETERKLFLEIDRAEEIKKTLPNPEARPLEKIIDGK